MYRSTCEAPSCGKVYEAKKKASRFCSPTCRQRAFRAKKAAPTAQPGGESPGGAAVINLPAPPVPYVATDLTGVYPATLAVLQEADRVNTPNGQHALLLAMRLDSGLTEAGSAFAALGRDFRAALTAATADVQDDGDELDGIRDQAFRVISGGRV